MKRRHWVLLAAFVTPAFAQTPALTSLSPSTVAANSAITLTLNGSNFSSGTSLLVGRTQISNPANCGNTCPITYSSASQLTVALTAANVGNPGTLSIQAQNGTAYSNALTLTVVQGTNNP